MPVSRGVFLSHGEAEAMGALKARLGTLVPPERDHHAATDDGFDLGKEGARRVEQSVRLQPEKLRTSTGTMICQNSFLTSTMRLPEKQMNMAAKDHPAVAPLLLRLKPTEGCWLPSRLNAHQRRIACCCSCPVVQQEAL